MVTQLHTPFISISKRRLFQEDGRFPSGPRCWKISVASLTALGALHLVGGGFPWVPFREGPWDFTFGSACVPSPFLAVFFVFLFCVFLLVLFIVIRGLQTTRYVATIPRIVKSIF